MALGVVRHEADGQTDRLAGRQKSQEHTREAGEKRGKQMWGKSISDRLPFHANEC